MPDPRTGLVDQDPYHIEAKQLFCSPEARNPHRRRSRQLTLLAPVHRLHRVPEALATPRLDFDERHYPAPLRYEVEVAVATPEPPIQYSPAPLGEPRLGDSLAFLTKQLARCRHERKDAGALPDARIELPPLQPRARSRGTVHRSELRRLTLRDQQLHLRRRNPRHRRVL